MGLFNFSLKKKAYTPVASGAQFYPLHYVSGSMISNISLTKDVDTKTVQGQLKAYQYCSPITSIVNDKVSAAKRGKFWIGTEDGKEQDMTDKIRKVRALMRQPNKDEDFKAFFGIAKTMVQVYGKCYIWKRYGAGLNTTVPTELRVIPNTDIQIIMNTSAGIGENIVDHYVITYNNKRYDNITPDQLIIWNDSIIDISGSTNRLYTTGSEYNGGQSRLYALRDEVNTIVAAHEAANKLLTNLGVQVILTPAKGYEGVVNPFDPEQKAEILEDLTTKHGIMRGQSPFMVSRNPIDVKNVSRAIGDLQIPATVEASTREICNAYLYPMELMGFDLASSQNKITEVLRKYYQDAIIPESESFCELINKEFGLSGNNIARVDYSHLAIMQESATEIEAANKLKIENASKLFADKVITKDAYLSIAGVAKEYMMPDPPSAPESILAERIGVGGTQAMIQILTDATLTAIQKKNSLIVLFGLSEEQAARMLTNNQ